MVSAHMANQIQLALLECTNFTNESPNEDLFIGAAMSKTFSSWGRSDLAVLNLLFNPERLGLLLAAEVAMAW